MSMRSPQAKVIHAPDAHTIPIRGLSDGGALGEHHKDLLSRSIIKKLVRSRGVAGDRVVDLALATLADEWAQCMHPLDSSTSSHAQAVAVLPMSTSRLHRSETAVEDLGGPVHHISVNHHHLDCGKPGVARRAFQETPLAFQEPGYPIQVSFGCLVG